MPRDREILIERFATTFQLSARQPGESGRFRGIASVFGSIVDTFPNRTKIRPGAFRRTLADRAQRVKILSAHDQSSIPIGLPISMMETSEGLEIVASLNETHSAKDWSAFIAHAKKLGKLDAVEMSIGFDALQSMEERDEETDEVFRVILELRLWEVSLVAFGAD